uniref:MP n=1 Tax=Anthurium alphaflexivirus 1 TaxID=2794424 RepID=A0A7T5UG64_9VIRU|nr:MP [Anthurium alphaflexivirus 1]
MDQREIDNLVSFAKRLDSGVKDDLVFYLYENNKAELSKLPLDSIFDRQRCHLERLLRFRAEKIHNFYLNNLVFQRKYKEWLEQMQISSPSMWNNRLIGEFQLQQTPNEIKPKQELWPKLESTECPIMLGRSDGCSSNFSSSQPMLAPGQKSTGTERLSTTRITTEQQEPSLLVRFGTESSAIQEMSGRQLDSRQLQKLILETGQLLQLLSSKLTQTNSEDKHE